MSWSIHSFGKPAAVKAALAIQFENAKRGTAHVPHEQQAVELIERIVHGQIDYLAEISGMGIQVTASGSAYKTSYGPGTCTGHSNVQLEVKPMLGLAE